MADSDLPGLSALAGASLADGDLFHVVDVSDTTAAADGTDKYQTAAELVIGLNARGLASDAEVSSAVAAHTGDSSAAHAASAISADSTTLVGTGTDVQAVLEELDNSIADHLADTADAHDASAISILDTANDFTATDVEGALAELQSDAETHAAAADPHTGYVLESLFDAHTVIYATSDNTPAALTVSAETVVGRITGGNIAAVNPSNIAQTINTQTDDYTLALSDAGKVIYMNCGDTDTLTVPKNSVIAFPVGTRVDIVQANFAITITPVDGDVTINVNALLTKVTNGQWSGCTLLKTATDVWCLFGDLVPAA